MRRLLLLLTIFLVSGIWSDVQAAAVKYDPAQLGGGANNLMGGTTAGPLERRTTKVGMTSNGVPLIIARRRTTDYYDLWWTGNGGTTWSTTANIFAESTTVGSHNAAIYTFGDSAWLTSDLDLTLNRELKIALLNDDSVRTVLDTLSLAYTTGNVYMRTAAPNAVVVPYGSAKIMVGMATESTTDSFMVLKSSGAFTGSHTYSRQEASSTIPSYGWRVPFRWATNVGGGAAIFDQAAQDLYWIDSLSGINAALTTSFLNYTGSYDGQSIVAMNDSMGMVVWQNSVTAGSDSLRWKRFYITTTSGGSPTITYIDSGTVESEAAIRDGVRCDPVLSHINGTDSVIVCYKFWPDTSIDYATDIARRVFNGTSWSARETWYDVTGEDTLAYLQAPPRVYNIAGNIRHFVAFTDSTNTTDSLHVIMDVLVVGSATTGPRTSLKKWSLKKATLWHYNRDLWREDD